MPTQEFARTARDLCDLHKAILILDDIRAGFRINLGGSWEELGVRPDLSAYSKALGNGYAIAAVTGSDTLREAAQKVFVTGSFWCSATAMAAALATLKKLHDLDVISHISNVGNRFRKGIASQAAKHGIGIRQTGPAQLPLILFDNDPDFEKGNIFTATALQHGVYLHPWHNMFLSAAHTEADIDLALEGTEHAFAAVARLYNTTKT